jgi:hypothetical protein
MLTPLTAACISLAASAFGVSEPALWMILHTEGGRVGACTPQRNGTHDCGPAQVNAETWVPRIARFLQRPEPEIYTELRDNGCFNIYAAAYVLSLMVDQAGGDAWDGIGRYNSATPGRKEAYQARIAQAYQLLFVGPRSSQ